MIDNGGDGQMTPLLRLAAGAGAGIVGMSATYPLDMVRTKGFGSSFKAAGGMVLVAANKVARRGIH